MFKSQFKLQLVAWALFSFPAGGLSFIVPHGVSTIQRHHIVAPKSATNLLALQHTWVPQDLTRDNPGYRPIPDDDYVKQYQRHPELWPVEFFLIVHRRTKNGKTQLLVRKSANGTAQYGVGTGVPATRWLLSTAPQPPQGYEWSTPHTTFEAANFPEFPKSNGPLKSWTYRKIDIREHAFHGPGAAQYQDAELEEYARKVQKALKKRLSEMIADSKRKQRNAWESSQLDVVKRALDKDNSVAAIQGTLRMSGLFARQTATDDSAPKSLRYVSLDDDLAHAEKLAQSVWIFTMFPQMPDPMPDPMTHPEELREEIYTRPTRMAATQRDPHRDPHGRVYTHISTSNVSNTIHGVYLTLDATTCPKNLENVPALNLFGTERIQREWKSFEDLKVLELDGKTICMDDPKPVFISGYVVRQLVKEKVIALD